MSDEGWICSGCHRRVFRARVWHDRVSCSDCEKAQSTTCSCGNSFDGDNFCMPSACQWET